MFKLVVLISFVCLVSYPILGFVIIKAFVKKDKKKFYKISILLLITILIPGFLWRIIPGSDFLWKPFDIIQERKYNKQITGYEFTYEDVIYEYNSVRSLMEMDIRLRSIN